jgi:hypothetical protein
MADVWDRTLGLLQARFITNALLPVLLLGPAVILTLAVGTGTWETIHLRVRDADTGTKIVGLLGYALAAWFLAAFVQSQWRNLVRLYEGYPLRLVPAIREWGVTSHRRRLALAQDDKRLGHVQYYRYPLDVDDVMPTRLGNALRAAERYPHDRYGADSIIVWPRLAPLVPPRFAAQLDEFRGAMEFLVVVATWSAIYAATTGAGLVVLGGSPWVFALVLLGGFSMAWFAYRGAVVAAVEYGEQLRVGHDLYRFRLIRQLHLPAPSSLDEEKRQWEALHEFIYSNYVESLTYEPGEPAPNPDEEVSAS